jgi:hypothetical protein
MMGEEPVLPAFEPRAAEELPEDTPHYLNPQVLQEQREAVAYDAEETETSGADEVGEAPRAPVEADGGAVQVSGEAALEAESTSPSQAQSPERLEEVMNSGLQFISGLLEMATGQKLSPLAAGDSMIRVDKQTGEVTMKFKLPGF